MSDKNFRVRHGLEVGDTVSVDASNGNIATTGTIITDSTIETSNGTTGEVIIGGGTSGKVEIGQYNRASSGTPYIDFHSSANPVDYDVRLIASGGSSTDGQGTLTVTAATISVGGDLTVTGNLTVTGTTTTVNSTTLTVDDKNIELGSVTSPTDTTADGGGITLKGSTDKTITWLDSNDSWNFNQNIVTTGTLDVQGGTITDSTGALSITSGAGGNITLTPDGTGDVVLSADTVKVGDANIDATITTNGKAALTINAGDASGTDQTGSNTTIRAGNGTGTGGSGSIILQTAPPSTTGSTANTMANTLTLASGANGNITLAPNGTGVVTVASDLAVNGGDITTTQTTASLFNATATTLNLGGAATTTNIGPATTGSSIVSGANRLISPVIFNFAGANNYRGLLLSNLTSGSYAAARNGLVMRTVPTTAIGPRGGIVFENARSNSSGVLAALQGPSTTQAGDFLGEITSGGYATDRYVTEAVATTSMAFTPYATETWVNSGTTVSNAGTGWALQLQPTATNLTATSKITTVDTTPQNLSLRSDAVGISKGKTVQFIATGCSTSGTTLTIGTLTSGTVAVGTMIQNSTNLLPAGTYIVANISGSGSGSTWQLNQTQTTYTGVLTLAGYQGFMAMTTAGNVEVIPQMTTRGPVRYAVTTAGNFAGGSTYTPAATVSNAISCTINSGTGGFTVALTNLIADSTTGGHYQIFVLNSSGSNQSVTTTGGVVNVSHNLVDGAGMMMTIYIVGTGAFCEHIA